MSLRMTPLPLIPIQKTTVNTEAPESPADEPVAVKAPADAAVSDSTEKTEKSTE